MLTECLCPTAFPPILPIRSNPGVIFTYSRGAQSSALRVQLFKRPAELHLSSWVYAHTRVYLHTFADPHYNGVHCADAPSDIQSANKSETLPSIFIFDAYVGTIARNFEAR
jgi:hypothetical protein